ncbi:hypothetical protein QYZ15_21685 [Xanthomonas campestris pv. campestris]|uniref:hypothetical protein n=1 Tax=Xanthomonas campestris TaxID=339 RepID=UPI002AD2CE71|nr:hypothetical protein [Xanthomonas campestris]MEA0709481.1 hypothetical protein [Xanthomonas campestris pv. campestris]MEA0742666.1 hypothetical protein [Xanthomonas campestris pv. campestris]
MTEEPAEPVPFKPNPAGIFAWAQYEISTATISRVSDDEDGPRIAITLHELGNPLWRSTPENQADLERRVRKAWPELDADQVRKCLAHISARIRVEMMKPSQSAMQEEQREALRGNWVHGWRL